LRETQIEGDTYIVSSLSPFNSEEYELWKIKMNNHLETLDLRK